MGLKRRTKKGKKEGAKPRKDNKNTEKKKEPSRCEGEGGKNLKLKKRKA